MKQKQISLNSYFGCSSSFKKPKNNNKTKKTSPSSLPRLIKYKTVEKNLIEKSLAPFDARIWLQYNKVGEYATNLCCKVCTQFREHVERTKYFKEDLVTGSTNYCSSIRINHVEGVSQKEAKRHYYKSIGKTHVEKRDGNQ